MFHGTSTDESRGDALSRTVHAEHAVGYVNAWSAPVRKLTGRGVALIAPPYAHAAPYRASERRLLCMSCVGVTKAT